MTCPETVFKKIHTNMTPEMFVLTGGDNVEPVRTMHHLLTQVVHYLLIASSSVLGGRKQTSRNARAKGL